MTEIPGSQPEMGQPEMGQPEMGQPAGELGAAFASLVDELPPTTLSASGVQAASQRARSMRRNWVLGISAAAVAAAAVTVTVVAVNIGSHGSAATATSATSATRVVTSAAASAGGAAPELATSSAAAGADSPDAQPNAAGGKGNSAGGTGAESSAETDASSALCEPLPLAAALTAVVHQQLGDLTGPVTVRYPCEVASFVASAGAFEPAGPASGSKLVVAVLTEDTGVCSQAACESVPGTAARYRQLGDGQREVFVLLPSGALIQIDAPAPKDASGAASGPPAYSIQQLVNLGLALAGDL